MTRPPARSRSSLFLLELIVVLLLFALASTVCVRLFAQAKLTSRQSADTTMAVLQAQQAAERLKAGGEDALAAQGAVCEGGRWTLGFDAAWQPVGDAAQAVYQLRVTPEPLKGATRYALELTRGGEPLYQLSVVRLDDGGGEL